MKLLTILFVMALFLGVNLAEAYNCAGINPHGINQGPNANQGSTRRTDAPRGKTEQ